MKKRLLALEASAGSGKTYALSLRFVALVLEKIDGKWRDISNILAITFTNKAASEMKSKIIDAFFNLDSNRIQGICDLTGMSGDEVLKARDERKNEFLRAELKIYTFDSFFSQILRQFSLNLGLMPDFENGENLGAKINENLVRILENHGMSELAKYLKAADFTTAESFLKASKAMLFFDTEPKNALKPDDSDVWAKYEELKKVAMPLCAKKGLSAFDKVKKTRDFHALLFDENESKTAKNAINECENEKKALVAALKEYYKKYSQYKISQFFKLLNEYKKARQSTIKTNNAMEFCDVSAFVYRLLKNGDDKIGVNELYFRLDGRIDDILIDEFQDTNAVQFEILYPLIDEIISGRGSDDKVGSFFYVGDKKQSIYAFRGSNKDVFEHLWKDCFNGQIKCDSLKDNFRSAKNIVEFVNSTFKDKILGYTHQKPKSDKDGLVRVVSFESKNFLSVLDEQVEFLLKSGAKPSQITILCWKNEDITSIKEHLEKKYKVSSSAKLLREAKEVRILLSALQMCLFENTRQFLGQFLALYGISFEPKKLEINSAQTTLKRLVKELGIKNSQNILKLYEIASSKNNIYEFFYSIYNNDTMSCDTSIDGINVMTVHKSKGLSLAHCIVCDNLGGKNNDEEPFLHYFDYDEKEWKIALNEKILADLGDENYIKVSKKLESIYEDEEMNKLYVALTRAEHTLIVLGKIDGNGISKSYFKQYSRGSGANKELFSVLKLDDCQKGEFCPKDEEIKNSFESRQINDFENVPRQKVALKSTEESMGVKNQQNLRNIYFGKALHYAFEMSGDFSANAIESALQASFNKYGYLLGDDAFSAIKADLESFKEVYSSFGADFSFLKEHEIAYNNEILRLDALILKENLAIILDYKSSQNAATNSLEKMSLYKKAVYEIYKKDTKAYFVVFDKGGCELQEC